VFLGRRKLSQDIQTMELNDKRCISTFLGCNANKRNCVYESRKAINYHHDVAITLEFVERTRQIHIKMTKMINRRKGNRRKWCLIVSNHFCTSLVLTFT